MHIPDGYLSPKTSAAFFAFMLPVWYVAAAKVEKTLKLKELPLLSFGAAFVFAVMMLNFPMPGGSTGHIVGGAIIAIVLGPWASVVAMTLALTLQAFVFGDGGVLALGANAFNMAFVMSFSGYYVYRLLKPKEHSEVRSFVAVFVAAYVAVNLSALAVAAELGIQPLIAANADGAPLYAPYPLEVTVPAMMIPHLLFFGPVEGFATALTVSYLFKRNKALLKSAKGTGAEGAGPLGSLLFVVALLIVATPLGLLSKGTPWGEWGLAEFSSINGFVPVGMAGLSEWWGALIPDYGASSGGAAYIMSAALGSFILVFAIYIFGRVRERVRERVRGRVRGRRE